MRTLREKKSLIATLTVILIILAANTAAASFTYYKSTLDYDNGKIEVTSIEMEISEKEIEPPFGFYVARILDFEGKTLNTTFFKIPTTIYYDKINPETGKIGSGGKEELEKVSFELFLPYYPNAKEIIIYNEDLKEIARKDVKDYSQTKCGDSICQSFESYQTCKLDCPSGAEDGSCDKEKDGKCDPDCTEKLDPDCEVKEGLEKPSIEKKITENWELIIIILLVIIILTIFIVISRNKKSYSH